VVSCELSLSEVGLIEFRKPQSLGGIAATSQRAATMQLLYRDTVAIEVHRSASA
jgi:hypothetical protein